MTDAEFQRKYHEYRTRDEAEAKREAESVVLEDGSHPAVVGLPFGPTVYYCLMLPSAAKFIGGLYPV